MEADLAAKLDWIVVDHHNTGHPHSHIIVSVWHSDLCLRPLPQQVVGCHRFTVQIERKGKYMRGLGEFQRGQMKHRDARTADLFVHFRRAIDLVEEIWLYPFVPPAPKEEPKPKSTPEKQSVEMPVFKEPKLVYTIKDVRNLIGISHTGVYRAINAGQLRALKCGNKTLILATDVQAWIDSLKPSH